MKTVIKTALLVASIIVLLGIAGTSDYTEAVIYNMPQQVYDGIVEEHPDFSQKEIADFYMENKEEIDNYYNTISE